MALTLPLHLNADTIPLMSNWFCNSCEVELTAEEHEYYDDRCEACERAWSHRIDIWRKGGHDPVLDDLYSEVRVLH
jgi:hypothetical protein